MQAAVGSQCKMWYALFLILLQENAVASGCFLFGCQKMKLRISQL